VSTCGSCGAPIVFVRTTAGGRMPLDLEPHESGNVLVAYSYPDPPSGFVLTSDDVLAWAHGQGVRLYRSHFASCPDADKWRRESRRNRAAQPEGGTE